MNNTVIRYDLIVQDAMLGVVRKVLLETEKHGLSGNHHFYITFSTSYPAVQIPPVLLEKYPEEITIVLQHEFENLTIGQDSFSVTLWFDNIPTHLTVPFHAIKAFFDPSVKFGLQFNVLFDQEDLEESISEKEISVSEQSIVSEETGEKVVSLDAFRKK